MEEAVKKGAVLKEKMSKVFINGKDTVAVSAGKQFKRHTGGAFLSIFNTAGGAEPGVASEGNKLHVAAVRTGIHCAALGMVAAKEHPVHVGDNNRARM